MLLTLKQSIHEGFKGFHEYSRPSPPSPLRYSLTVTNAALPSLAATANTASATNTTTSTTSTNTTTMATPHRGLPPPAGMALSAPPQVPPPVSQPVPLPNPPSQWQGDSMRNWLQAKSEDDRRRQEEEKTRQETVRLEVRRVEYNMLRESLAGGVPPHMIPMVFAGISGGNLANMSIEWVQHYIAQLQQQQQQQQQQQIQAFAQGQLSPEIRREPRMIAQQPQYGTPPQSITTGSVTPQTALPTGSQGQTATFLPYQVSPTGRPSAKQTPVLQQQQVLQVQQNPPTTLYSRPGPPTHSTLPRLNTDELHIQPPPQPPISVQLPQSGPIQPMPPSQGTGSAQPAPSNQEQTTSSPLYFHHWVPPSSQTAAGPNQPTTPSAKSTDSPFSSSKRASHFGDPDHASSPKKRKGQTGQATTPASSQPQPQSQPPRSSPQFPQSVTSTVGTRRRGHSRNRSDSSVRGHDSHGRPSSRHRRSEGGVGSQVETSTKASQGQGGGGGGGGGGGAGAGAGAAGGGVGTAATGADDNNGSSGSHQQSPLQHETRPDEPRD